MLWVLFSAIAILIGIAMFAKVQPDLPPELEFLKNVPTSMAVDVAADGGANLRAVPMDGAATGWQFRGDSGYSEASKDFEQHIAGPNGAAYDKPEFALTCYRGKLYARVNTRVRAAGSDAVSFGFKGLSGWNEAQNQNWYAQDAKATVARLKSQSSVTVRIAFAELGLQEFTFKTAGLSTVLDKMSDCAV